MGIDAVMLKKPEEQEAIKATLREAVVIATVVAARAEKALGIKLPASDPVMKALKDAQRPKNIADAQVARSADGSIYTMKITLVGGEERILTIRAAPKSLEVMLTNNTGSLEEYIRQEGNRITKTTPKS